jgi:hypothetical protein
LGKKGKKVRKGGNCFGGPGGKGGGDEKKRERNKFLKKGKKK